MEQSRLKPPTRIVVLLSGRGSNFQSLIRNTFLASQVVGVASDKPAAPGLAIAAEKGYPIFAADRTNYSSISEQKGALFAAVRNWRPDLIVLAGYMQIIEPQTAEEFFPKIVNIHPALLPSYPGLHTHARALADSAPFHGASVHLVDRGVDTGPIIAQVAVPLLSADTEASLAARVLEREHQIYPWVVEQLCLGTIKFDRGAIRYTPLIADQAKKKGFIVPESAIVE